MCLEVDGTKAKFMSSFIREKSVAYLCGFVIQAKNVTVYCISEICWELFGMYRVK